MPLGSIVFNLPEDFLFANGQCLWLQFTRSELIRKQNSFQKFCYLPRLFFGIAARINCDGVQALIRIEKGSGGNHFHSNGLFQDGIFL